MRDELAKIIHAGIWPDKADRPRTSLDACRDTAAAVRRFIEDAVLPCDVTVAPATTFKRGVRISTLLDCIEDRRVTLNETEGWPCLKP